MRRAELDRLAAKLDEDDRNTLVEGEPDARPMGIGKGPKPPSYNVQTAVDAETGLIIHHEVTGDPKHAPALSNGQGDKGHARRCESDGGGRCRLFQWHDRSRRARRPSSAT